MLIIHLLRRFYSMFFLDLLLRFHGKAGIVVCNLSLVDVPGFILALRRPREIERPESAKE